MMSGHHVFLVFLVLWIILYYILILCTMMSGHRLFLVHEDTFITCYFLTISWIFCVLFQFKINLKFIVFIFDFEPALKHNLNVKLSFFSVIMEKNMIILFFINFVNLMDYPWYFHVFTLPVKTENPKGIFILSITSFEIFLPHASAPIILLEPFSINGHLL